jgi:hypothetical protein
VLGVPLLVLGLAMMAAARRKRARHGV